MPKTQLPRVSSPSRPGPEADVQHALSNRPRTLIASLIVFAAIRDAVGKEIDIAIDFHGAISPQTAGLLIKALEPYQPLFIEEPIQCQNVDVMAELARKTHIPIATGERIFTKWGFREILEKGAASSCSLISPCWRHL